LKPKHAKNEDKLYYKNKGRSQRTMINYIIRIKEDNKVKKILGKERRRVRG
jgi:hypothetical protein